MFRTKYEESYYEGLVDGFVTSYLEVSADFFSDPDSRDPDKLAQNDPNGFFAKSFPNMPSGLLEKMLKSTEIKDKSEKDKYLKQLYSEYENYIKSIPIYQYSKEHANKFLEIRRYKEIFSIIDNYEERSEDLDYNSESVIHILILVYSDSFSSPENIISLSDYDDTDSRIKAIDSLSSKATEILNDSKSVDALAERLYDTQTNDYRTYKYKDYFIVIKDYNDFYIYKAEAVDCSRPWLTIYNDKHHYEYVKYPERDKYNRIV